MKFRIQEPNRELTEGYFILIVKYLVLVFLAWMIGILIIFTYPCLVWEGDKYPPFLEFMNNYDILNWFLAILFCLLFTKKTFPKHKLGLITEFNFQEGEKQLQLEIINTLNGKLRTISIPYSSLCITSEELKSKFYGKQEIFHFKSNSELITSLCIPMTPWKKHSEIKLLEEKILEYTK